MKKLYFQNGNLEEISFKEMFDKFIKIKQCSNLSKDTIKYYERCYKSFSKFYDVNLPCSSITLDIVNDYIIFLKEKDEINDITVNTEIRGLRAILYYAMELGYVKEFKIKLIRAQKKIKETYTTEELQLLLKKPNIKKTTFAEYRNWVITNYLLGTGNRLKTVVSLKIKDINFVDNEINLKTTKNSKQYIIPLSTELSKILMEYLTYRKGEPDDYLFCTVFGQQLARRSLQTQIEKYNHSRGVTRTSIHAYRHTFAKLYILNGGDIFTLQKILGHSSLEMVREYVEMFTDELKINFNSYNPLDKLAQSNSKKINIS